jgi:hypothetical protein
MRSLAGRRKPEPGRRQLERHERPSSGLPDPPLFDPSEAASNLDSVLAPFTSDCPLSLKDTLSAAIAFFQWVGVFSDWVTDTPLVSVAMELFTADEQPEGDVICAHLLKRFQLAVIRGARRIPAFRIRLSLRSLRCADTTTASRLPAKRRFLSMSCGSACGRFESAGVIEAIVSQCAASADFDSCAAGGVVSWIVQETGDEDLIGILLLAFARTT